MQRRNPLGWKVARDVPSIEVQDAAARAGLNPMHTPTNATKAQVKAYDALCAPYRLFRDGKGDRVRPPSVSSIAHLFEVD